MPSSRRAAAALACALAVFTGCKSADKPAQNSTKATRLFAISVDSAAFFRHGPQAGRDPDLRLPKDTAVKLIRPSFGYSKIQVVESGLKGYVASEEIRPASSALLAAASVHSVQPADSGALPPNETESARFNLNSDDPRLVPPPEALPDPDLPAVAPTP
ncbi:MAG TPA: hypothetical protein VGW39_11200 [Chthoniobacterales bacterium]|nr:hypothetical protein [Chthoniobacterales bacterium]